MNPKNKTDESPTLDVLGFTRNHQAYLVVTRSNNGLGLGLSIVRY
ncbi:hypothetical protein [Microcoleus sp. herbarium12]